MEWEHAGIPCVIVRSPVSGALHGYVGIPVNHPWLRHYNRTAAFVAPVEIHLVKYRHPITDVACQHETVWVGFGCDKEGLVTPMLRMAALKSVESHLPAEYWRDENYADLDFVIAKTNELATRALVAIDVRVD